MKIGAYINGFEADCFAVAGVFSVLKKHGLMPTHVSSGGIGAFISAMYLCGFEDDEVLIKSNELLPFLNRISLFKRISFVLGGAKNSGDNLGKLLEKNFRNKNVFYISDIKSSILINCTELSSGESRIFTNCPKEIGDGVKISRNVRLSEALRCSMGMCGLILPCNFNGMMIARSPLNSIVDISSLRTSGAEKIIEIVIKSVDKKADSIVPRNDESRKKSVDFRLNINLNRREKMTPKQLFNIGSAECERALNQLMFKLYL